MAIRQRVGTGVVIAGCAAAGWLAAKNYAALPDIEGTLGVISDAQTVSIIIPARNEAARLPSLLHSLRALDYPIHEIIVVDDGSIDGTGEIARKYGMWVIRVENPPAGWIGKCHACWTGAAAATGDWLLFTDADTVHGPRSLPLALRWADASGAGLISLLARQRCSSFWERLLLPYAYALYFVGASRVNEPGGTPVANGQYMLFRRETYERVGGHASVRGDIVEDVALAHVAAERGVCVLLLRAEGHFEVRMYDGLASLWEGFGKNAARFVTASPRSGLPTILAAIALGSALPAAVRERSLVLRCALLLTPAASLLPWSQRYGVAARYLALYPLAAAVFQLIAFDSMRRSLSGGTVWKGRRY